MDTPTNRLTLDRSASHGRAAVVSQLPTFSMVSKSSPNKHRHCEDSEPSVSAGRVAVQTSHVHRSWQHGAGAWALSLVQRVVS
jgi:hypothetical protein